MIHYDGHSCTDQSAHDYQHCPVAALVEYQALPDPLQRKAKCSCGDSGLGYDFLRTDHNGCNLHAGHTVTWLES